MFSAWQILGLEVNVIMLKKLNLFYKPQRYLRDVLFCSSNATKTDIGLSNDNRKVVAVAQPTHFSHPHLLKENEITPNITKNEYENRRDSLLEKISEFTRLSENSSRHNILIVPSSKKQFMSDKIPYFFRQDTEFLYLTGCLEPDSCLVIFGGNNKKTHSILFVSDHDPHAELWDGPRINPEDVHNFLGINQGLPTSELSKYLQSYFKSHKDALLWYDSLSTTPKQSEIDETVKCMQNIRPNSPKIFLHQARSIKSDSEIELMRKTCRIASEAIVETIRSSKPGDNEHEIFARVDFECKMKGAQYLAYPPVVAGGKRANIIHYITNNRVVNDGELVLMDAGCEYYGYSSDITRTWPINGKFTKEQSELYEIVLETQIELIRLLDSFPTLDMLFHSMCHVLGKKLQSIGLIPKSASKETVMKTAYKFCPHHVSHYLGMDVHDTPAIARNIAVKPGMIVTVEPGVYVRQDDTTVPENYRGIGIRIEDDVLITENGPQVLTANCPKDLRSIEKTAQ